MSRRTLVIVAAGVLALVATDCAGSARATAPQTRATSPVTVQTVPGLDLPDYEEPVLHLPGVDASVDLRTCQLTAVLNDTALHFGRDSAQLPASGPDRAALDQVIANFATATDISINGYTSYSDGTYLHNLVLSHQRADAVAAVVHQRFPHMQVDAVGDGPTDPVSVEDGTETSRAPNRRVVLTATIRRPDCDGQ